MNLDIHTYRPQAPSSEVNLIKKNFVSISQLDELTKEPLGRKESTDDFCDDTQIQNWEDEGGAYTDRAYGVFRDSGLTAVNRKTKLKRRQALRENR